MRLKRVFSFTGIAVIAILLASLFIVLLLNWIYRVFRVSLHHFTLSKNNRWFLLLYPVYPRLYSGSLHWANESLHWDYRAPAGRRFVLVCVQRKTKLDKVASNPDTDRNKLLFRVFLEWVFVSMCCLASSAELISRLANFKLADSRTFGLGQWDVGKHGERSRWIPKVSRFLSGCETVTHQWLNVCEFTALGNTWLYNCYDWCCW